jgi:hypothetical protein
MSTALGGGEFAQAWRQVAELESRLIRRFDQRAGEWVPTAFAGIQRGSAGARGKIDDRRWCTVVLLLPVGSPDLLHRFVISLVRLEHMVVPRCGQPQGLASVLEEQSEEKPHATICRPRSWVTTLGDHIRGSKSPVHLIGFLACRNDASWFQTWATTPGIPDKGQETVAFVSA